MSADRDGGEPFVWSTGLYELASIPGSGRYGETLALCVQHRGAHVRHGRPGEQWCQALPRHRPMSRIERALAKLRNRREEAR